MQFQVLKLASLGSNARIINTILLAIFTSLAEALSVGSIAPIILIVSSVNYSINFLGNQYEIGLNIFISIFIALLLITASLKIALFKKINELGHDISVAVAEKIYRISLNIDLEEMTKINSSKIIDFILQKPEIVVGVAKSYINILTSIIILIGIITLLFYKSLIFTSIILVFSSIYFYFVIKIYRRKLQYDSKFIAKNNSIMIKLIQESVNGIREIILNNEVEYRTRYLLEKYRKLHNAQKSIQFKSGLPRIIFEVYITILVTGLIWVILNFDIISKVHLVAFLAILALSMQRLLPILNLMYGSWTEIKGHQQSILDLIAFVKKYEKPSGQNDLILATDVSEKIELIGLNYKFNNKYIYKSNINFKIIKNQKIAIIGKSGSGKSTLINLIAGLIKPTHGIIQIDGTYGAIGKNWQKNISFVPQNIMLSDDSIISNIIMNCDYDEYKLKKVIDLSELDDVVDANKNGLLFRVGEFGSRLSGGQRQRIGLARALYMDRAILLLDELTNGMNESLSRSVLSNVLSLEKTVIFITHNTTGLEYFDQVLNLDVL